MRTRWSRVVAGAAIGAIAGTAVMERLQQAEPGPSGWLVVIFGIAMALPAALAVLMSGPQHRMGESTLIAAASGVAPFVVGALRSVNHPTWDVQVTVSIAVVLIWVLTACLLSSVSGLMAAVLVRAVRGAPPESAV